MALMGRDGNLDRGDRKSRKPRVRARARSCARFQVELLETRVLLFGGPFVGPFQLLPPATLIHARAVVSHATPGPTASNNLATIVPLASQEAGDAGTLLESPLQQVILAAPQYTTPSAVVDRGSPIGFSGFRLISLIAGNQAAFQDAGSPADFTVQRGDIGVQGSEPSVVASPLDHSGPISSLWYASQSENGQTGPEMVVSPIPAFAGLGGGFSAPGGYHEAMAGTLEPSHPFFEIEYTIETPDESFNFALLHGAGENGMPPAFMMKMFDANGNPLAEYNPEELGPPGGAPPDLNVSLRSAPVGGKLVVQVTQSESSTSAAGTVTTDPAASTGNWSVPFVLYVQRQDDEAQAASSGLPTQGVIAAGTLALTSSGQVVLPTSFDGPAVAIATGAADPAPSTQDSPPPATAGADEPALVSADGFNLRVPTGPFASWPPPARWAWILAGIGTEPTPEVDRNEGALFHEIERREADPGFLGGDRALEFVQAADPDAQSDEPGGRVRAVSGAGGFAYKVTGLANGRRTNLRALLATIPVAAEERGSSALTGWSDRPYSPLPSPGPCPAASAATFPVYVGFIKAACGLALGLGMSSRAIFPDLLSSLRRRVSKWPRRRQAPASGAGPLS